MRCRAPRGMKNGTRSDGSALMTAHCSLLTVGDLPQDWGAGGRGDEKRARAHDDGRQRADRNSQLAIFQGSSPCMLVRHGG